MSDSQPGNGTEARKAECALLARQFALPFGDATATLETSFSRYRDSIASVMSGLEDIGQGRESPGAFANKAATLRLTDLTLVASANTPVEFRLRESLATTLTIPFAGEIIASMAGQRTILKPGCSGVFLAGEAVQGDTRTRSALMLKLLPERILATASAMLGSPDAASRRLDVHRSRPLPLVVGRVSFEQLFRDCCQLIDHFRAQPAALAALALDDTFYRITVMMLAPDAFLAPERQLRQDRHADAIRRLCEYLRANLFRPLTLTDMERQTGLPARTLSRAFRNALGCSPMAWVQEQRLLEARRGLALAREGETVANVAMHCGFTRLGAFATLFRQRFGESPSQTLKRRGWH